MSHWYRFKALRLICSAIFWQGVLFVDASAADNNVNKALLILQNSVKAHEVPASRSNKLVEADIGTAIDQKISSQIERLPKQFRPAMESPHLFVYHRISGSPSFEGNIAIPERFSGTNIWIDVPEAFQKTVIPKIMEVHEREHLVQALLLYHLEKQMSPSDLIAFRQDPQGNGSYGCRMVHIQSVASKSTHSAIIST